jgi:FKBP-type peptidyl-prolyl cis-trans isomerase SlyD
MRMLVLSSALALTMLAASSPRAEEEQAKSKVVAAGSQVSIEYTLKLDDGTTADSNVGGEPLVYTQGEQSILPALEAALAGLGAGDTKQVTLSAEEGYGVVDPGLYKEVEATLIPEDGRHVGAQLMSRGPDGQPFLVRVRELKGEKIVLDLNHPLAGETLHFDVKVVAVD